MMNHSLIVALLFGVALAQQGSQQTGGQNKQQTTFSPVSAEPIAPATQQPVPPSTVSAAPAAISPAPSSISTAPATTSPAPSIFSLDPATVSPAPTTISTAPSTISLSPGTVSPALGTVSPAQGTVSPALSTVSPAQGTVSQAPSAISVGTTSSAPSAMSPVPSFVSPVPSSSAPVSNTVAPSGAPSAADSEVPTAIATNLPSAALSLAPSVIPSEPPTILPIPDSTCKVGCPGSASRGTNGFSTIDDLNCQIQYDWDVLQLGGSVPVPPTYILCPNTAFTMTTSSSSSEVTLLLNNSLLLCGEDGALSNECLLTNVTIQVQNLDSITIRGISFQSSSLLHTGIGSLDVQNCSFGGQGGPVVMAEGTTQTSLTNCSFESIEYVPWDVAYNGTTTGDALVFASNGVLALEQVQITGTFSTASTTLDLIRAENAAITINDCQLTNNTVNNMVMGEGTSTVSLSGTTLDGNDFANALSCEGTVDVTVNKCAVTGNRFSASLVSLSNHSNMVMTDSKLYSNVGGLSIAALRGTARFESVSFDSNVAPIGIEVFSEIVMNAVGWNENEAEWHMYIRSGGSLSFGKASVVSTNLAAVAVFFLESNAACEIHDTLVTTNNVTGFHLMSVLDFSTLDLINTTISLNDIANTAIFAYSTSQVRLNQVSLSDNTIEKSLFRSTTNSKFVASNVTATKNTVRGDLVMCDTGSSISVSDADFSDNIVEGGMAVVLNSTATYEQIGLSNNKGGTALVGMFQSLENAVLQLNDVYAQSNAFDSFAFVSGASSLDANLVFVSGHVGLTITNFTYWEVYAISNASSLVLSDSVIDSTIPFAFVHVSHSSSATVDGLHILGDTSDATNEESYGIFIDAKSTSSLGNVCFDGGDYTYLVWSQSGKFLYSNVSATLDTIATTNNDNCRAMFVNDECIDFDSSSCGSTRVTMSPATPPQAAPSTEPTSNCPTAGRSIGVWSILPGILSIIGVFLL